MRSAAIILMAAAIILMYAGCTGRSRPVLCSFELWREDQALRKIHRRR